jgi:hypothetical protein
MNDDGHSSLLRVSQARYASQGLWAERQSAIFKRLDMRIKGKEHVTLDQILVPDDPTDLAQTTWTSFVEAQALYKVLLSSRQKHFNQAVDTTFVTGPFANKLGPFADTEYGDAILQGTVDFHALAAITKVKDLIQGMQYPDPNHPTPTINTIITTDTFIDMVKHTCKRTSSFPSGRHFGHYRTLLQAPDLLGNIAAVANFCFQWGKSLKRWERVTHTLIPKEPGELREKSISGKNRVPDSTHSHNPNKSTTYSEKTDGK